MANKKDNKTIRWKKLKVAKTDLHYQKFQEFKAQMAKTELDNLERKTSRSHEVYRKIRKKWNLIRKR